MTPQSVVSLAQPQCIPNVTPAQNQDCNLPQVLTCISATMDRFLPAQTISNAFEMLLAQGVTDSGDIPKLMGIFLEPVARNWVQEW
jgi:hypothetical protein